MNALICTFTLAGSLMLSGCFSSPAADKEKIPQQRLHLLWEYAYDLDGGSPEGAAAAL